MDEQKEQPGAPLEMEKYNNNVVERIEERLLWLWVLLQAFEKVQLK